MMSAGELGADLADVDNVGVVEAEQDVDLADGSQREALLLLLHAHHFQRADATRSPLSRPAATTAQIEPKSFSL